MCGIAGAINLRGEAIPNLERRLQVMSNLIQHRGPDDDGIWVHERANVGLVSRRLSILDPEHGHQPMSDRAGRWIAYNGEVYNFLELQKELGSGFATSCDTEVVLRAYDRWGAASLDQLRGMYAYAVWDEPEQRLFLARDRFGIKPLYYARVDDTVYFASEIKALLPFLPAIRTDVAGLKDYLAFQFCLAGKTLFEGVRELPAAHCMELRAGSGIDPRRYWEVYYDIEFDRPEGYFEEQIQSLLAESVGLHLRSDVPVASYLSGGLDSSAIASLARSESGSDLDAFTGRFAEGPEFDESSYARAVASEHGLNLHEVDITVDDFTSSMADLVYHLDFPTAGPGSFPQYVVSRAAAEKVKVILGGQGGDEIFGGYTRYLIAYFEQCIKAAIDGTMHAGNFVVTYESIIPNLPALRNYKPLLQDFWRDGLFEDLGPRYFRLINRTHDVSDTVALDALGDYSPFETFTEIFEGSNVGHQAYFDRMTHFDFKTLLPALLHVEDRVSMAHGLESRVPLLDHRLVEMAATIPADVKFRNGEMKHVYRNAVREFVPQVVADRKDKMGFPVPLTEWLCGPARSFAEDVLGSSSARERELFDNAHVLKRLARENRYGRTTWGFLCLELWQQTFHDREHHFKQLVDKEGT